MARSNRQLPRLELPRMADDLQSRRKRAAAAARERRGYLGLTQDELAKRAGVVTRTIQSLESETKPTWPNPLTRARIERALGWRSGELHRLSAPAKAYVDPGLMDELRQLTPEQKRFAIRFLQEDLGLPAALASAEEEE